MGALYERIARPALFPARCRDPESAHDRVLGLLGRLSAAPAARSALGRLPRVRAPRTVFGIEFPNAVGLAAGVDRDALAVPAWAALGFGFVEVGTVSLHPGQGHPRPRLHHLRDSAAIINRIGFATLGAEHMARRLTALGRPPVPLGISLGRSDRIPPSGSIADYLAALRLLLPHADYLAINVSSPNTAGLRSLQERAALDELLTELRAHTLAAAGAAPAKPLLVKVAPDLSPRAAVELLEVCSARGVAGIIATNTTVSRGGLALGDAGRATMLGGLSGRPLHPAAVDMVRLVVTESAGTLPVIGVGGIASGDDALRMLDAGASLLQLCTGLVYRGPGLVRTVARAAAGH